MADDILFEMEWDGLEALEKELEQMDDQMESIILEEMTKFGTLAEEATQALAPRESGELETSINFDRAVKEGNEYVVYGGSNLPYALRRHEEPYRMGIYDKQPGDRYYIHGRGQATRAKPPWRGYQPGRKYLENAIKSIEKDYEKMNERILERILGGEES